MIPIPAWLTVRVAIWIGIVTVVALLGWRVSAWHDAYMRMDATEKALATSRKNLRQCSNSQTAAALAYAGAVRRAESIAAADRTTAERVERELQTNLAAADRAGRDLARRLRDHQARRCSGPVPAVAGSAAEPAGPAAQPGDGDAVDRATADHLAACALDAEELAGWQEWWDGVKDRR